MNEFFFVLLKGILSLFEGVALIFGWFCMLLDIAKAYILMLVPAVYVVYLLYVAIKGIINYFKGSKRK